LTVEDDNQKGAKRVLDMFIDEDSDGKWHRRCCHGITDEEVHNGEWMSPFQVAAEKVANAFEEMLLSEGGGKEEQKWYAVEQDWKAVYRRYKDGKRKETMLYSDDQKVGEYTTDLERLVCLHAMQACWLLLFLNFIAASTTIAHCDLVRTKPGYEKIQDQFGTLMVQAKSKKKRAVVMDLFGGIGAAVVCLKRLGIGMSKVIHVEHDKIANHVYSYCHHKRSKDHDGIEDMKHGAPPDGIKHVQALKFEKVEMNLEQIMEIHGRKCIGQREYQVS